MRRRRSIRAIIRSMVLMFLFLGTLLLLLAAPASAQAHLRPTTIVINQDNFGQIVTDAITGVSALLAGFLGYIAALRVEASKRRSSMDEKANSLIDAAIAFCVDLGDEISTSGDDYLNKMAARRATDLAAANVLEVERPVKRPAVKPIVDELIGLRHRVRALSRVPEQLALVQTDLPPVMSNLFDALAPAVERGEAA